MNTANHISQDDLALFALGLLPHDQMQAALEHLRGCDVCRTQIADLQGDMALYSLTADMHDPPASARERLLSTVAREKREPVARRDVLTMPAPATDRRRVSSFVTWAGWAVAAGFAATAALQFHHVQQLQGSLETEQARVSAVQDSASTSKAALSALTDPAALNVALGQPTGHPTAATPTGHAAYLPDRGALVFVANNLEPLKPYKVYELWLLPTATNQSPIPAASFRPDASGNATVILPTGPKFVAVKGFGVTMEDDKSQPQKPTLPILLVGNSKT